MRESKAIALSALSAALAVILLVAGAYFETLDLSCLFLASLCMMLPLCKDYYLGAFLAYVATTLLSLLLSAGRFQIIIPFAMFFGLHALVNELQLKFKINKILALLIKEVWFLGTLLVVYFFTQTFVSENESLQKYLLYILLGGGAVCFPLYDYLIFKFKTSLVIILKRLKL